MPIGLNFCTFPWIYLNFVLKGMNPEQNPETCSKQVLLKQFLLICPFPPFLVSSFTHALITDAAPLNAYKVADTEWTWDFWLFLEWQSCHSPIMVFCFFLGNLPRVIQVVFQIYRNIMLVFLFPISFFYFCLWGMVKLFVLNIFGMGNMYFFKNYHNQKISIHLVRILPFLAMISLLVLFVFECFLKALSRSINNNKDNMHWINLLQSE